LPAALVADDVVEPVKEYLAVREEAESQLAAGVQSYCAEEGRGRYAEAVAMPWREFVDLALRYIEEALGSSNTGGSGKGSKSGTFDVSKKGDHGRVRFSIYKKLSERLRYTNLNVPQRVPLPILVEVLVKAAFPGTGAASFTCFVPSKVDELMAEHTQRTAGTL
jgi:hypothetical protein